MRESISEFMERQGRRAQRLGRDAEAAAHEAYGMATRAGTALNLSSAGDVMRHGARLLEESESRARRAASNGVQQAKRQVAGVVKKVGETPGRRSAAVSAAGAAGVATGVVRGGVHAVEGLADGAVFAARLIDPNLDRLLSPEQSASDQLAKAARGAGTYVGKAVADPRMVVDDLKAQAHQMRVDLDPSATPVAPTFAGELRRNFDIGQNQGELAFDIGSLWVGGPAAKTAKGFGRISNVGNVDRYAAQGFSPEAARRLAMPYPRKGMGAHFIPRAEKLPVEYSDSVFNVLKPEGISKGDFYELHFKTDPQYHGGPIIRRGDSWSGRRLGLERYGPIGRLWHGSPTPLKARVGGLGAGSGALMYPLGAEESGS
jgi:hypothetical protein